MKRPLIGASTFCLLCVPWRLATEAILERGFAAIELFGDGPQAHYTKLDPGDRRSLKALSERCELSVHAPVLDLNIASANPCSQEEAARQYREAVYFAGEIGAKRLVVHEGNLSYWKLDRTEARLAATTSLRQVVDIARQVGVTVGLENTNYGKARTYDGWQEWVAVADDLADPEDPALRLVLDTGHAHLAGWDMAEMIRALAPRLAQMHIHDTGGVRDDHMQPGGGSVAWAAMGRAFVESGCEATLILESGPLESAEELRTGRDWLEHWLPD